LELEGTDEVCLEYGRSRWALFFTVNGGYLSRK
jgi:hypothetical protein